MNELISIVVPVYNVEKYLKKCIDSIINQTYKNLEIILVNDGSTDNSGKICDEYVLKDNRIKVIHKKNEGLSSARNLGIDISNGEYIIFVDSDDWIKKDMIKKLYEIIQKDNSDISICNYFLSYNEEDQIQKEKIEFCQFNNIEALKKLYDENFNIIMTISCCKLFKKNLFSDIKFPKGKIHEDEFTTYKLLYKSKKVSYTSEKMYYYRQREDSITHRKFDRQNLDAVEAFEERISFFKNIVKNKFLYCKSVESLYFFCMKSYFLYEKESNSDKKVLKFLRKKAKNILKGKSKLLWDFKLRIIYSSFIINPNLYKIIEWISKQKNKVLKLYNKKEVKYE
ncbi:MAG: glycosyltransferase family 2 protein [Clostridium sp.]|nr:glycosyltransferase family 2 protein [Clostridium sp.]